METRSFQVLINNKQLYYSPALAAAPYRNSHNKELNTGYKHRWGSDAIEYWRTTVRSIISRICHAMYLNEP
jgi:hypothetical protein